MLTGVVSGSLGPCNYSKWVELSRYSHWCKTTNYYQNAVPCLVKEPVPAVDWECARSPLFSFGSMLFRVGSIFDAFSDRGRPSQ